VEITAKYNKLLIQDLPVGGSFFLFFLSSKIQAIIAMQKKKKKFKLYRKENSKI
jgi:hypothetical protein